MNIGDILLSQYKIIEEIGIGGFGKTYKAINTKYPVERYYVVKYLCPSYTDPESLKIAKRLFEKEAKTLARLGAKNNQIPCLYAYSADEENGEFFLIEDFIEGQDLTKEFSRGKRWSEAETIEFLQELLKILSQVHEAGIIHRDIKPANIMRRQSDGKLVLIDFGAVKEIVNTAIRSTIAIGTPPYMSPEQGMGNPGKYSDVYAVGILGIKALTDLPSSKLMSLNQENLQQIWSDPNVKVTPHLKEVLGKMVRFKYTERYPDASEALKELIRKCPGLRKLLLTLGLAGLSVIAILQFLNQPSYAQLETYLENQEWQQADAETDKIILKIARENSSLDKQSINKIPCKSLQKIDDLWTDNSDGRFGFTPQKKAYLETDNEFNEYNESTYEAFAKKVGWTIFGRRKNYGDLIFTDIAPSGHLPSPGRVAPNERDLRFREREWLLSRFDACDSETRN